MTSLKKIIVLGSLNVDFVVPLERQSRIGETLAGGDVTFFSGGKGANQACAVGRLGGAVRMIGQVGEDPFGPKLIQNLQYAGVDTSGVGISSRPTGSAYIWVFPEGKNSIVISPGANAALTADMAVERMAAATPYAFLLGQLETPMPTIIAAFSAAKRARALTILDPAPFQELPSELIPLVDILTPNQVEAAALLGDPENRITTFDTAKTAAEALLQRGHHSVILKLGELGCYLATAEIRQAFPAFACAAVDTTAAGDAFNAALAVALSEGASLVDAAVFANAAASICVTRLGTQNSLPLRSEVHDLLAAKQLRLARLFA